MFFTVTAAVIVSAAPAPLDEDRSPATTVFPMSASSDQASVDIGEVICRGPLAVQAREQLHAGQRVLVTGELMPRLSLDRASGGDGVVLIIEATHIAVSLTDAGMAQSAPSTVAPHAGTTT